MSVTITAMAIPQTAYGDWDTIDARLKESGGDWERLRGGLIHLVCERLTREGNPVTRLEEVLIRQHYAATALHLPFLQVLDAVRTELATWPEPVLALCEVALDDDINYPTAPAAVNLTLAKLREYAPRAARSVRPPERHLGYFNGSRQRKIYGMEELKIRLEDL